MCNPPYIGTADAEISPGLRFEPEKALFSGKDGLDDIEFLLGHVGSSLASDGVFIFEIGAMQRGSVERIFERIPGIV